MYLKEKITVHGHLPKRSSNACTQVAVGMCKNFICALRKKRKDRKILGIRIKRQFRGEIADVVGETTKWPISCADIGKIGAGDWAEWKEACGLGGLLRRKRQPPPTDGTVGISGSAIDVCLTDIAPRDANFQRNSLSEYAKRQEALGIAERISSRKVLSKSAIITRTRRCGSDEDRVRETIRTSNGGWPRRRKEGHARNPCGTCHESQPKKVRSIFWIVFQPACNGPTRSIRRRKEIEMENADQGQNGRQIFDICKLVAVHGQTRLRPMLSDWITSGYLFSRCTITLQTMGTGVILRFLNRYPFCLVLKKKQTHRA